MTTHFQKPSKKILYLGILAAVIVLVIFISKNHIASSILGERKLTYSAIDNIAKEKDTDNDGLSDKAEINVWHTNPNNSDTDGDGTLDGVEVNEGRDPLKANSSGASPPFNDYLSAGDPRIAAAVATAISLDTTGGGNFTENLSKNFFTSYLSSQDQNGIISPANRSGLIQNILAGTPTSTAPTEKYIMSSLSIFDSATPTEIKTYGNDFARLYQADLDNYLNIQKPTYDQTAEFYQKAARDLSKIKVPRAVADIHLSLLNSYNQIYVALEDLTRYKDDPLKGLIDAKIFQNNRNILPTFYVELAAYFRKNGIIFSKDDPGNMWNNI